MVHETFKNSGTKRPNQAVFIILCWFPEYLIRKSIPYFSKGNKRGTKINGGGHGFIVIITNFLPDLTWVVYILRELCYTKATTGARWGVLCLPGGSDFGRRSAASCGVSGMLFGIALAVTGQKARTEKRRTSKAKDSLTSHGEAGPGQRGLPSVFRARARSFAMRPEEKLPYI